MSIAGCFAFRNRAPISKRSNKNITAIKGPKSRDRVFQQTLGESIIRGSDWLSGVNKGCYGGSVRVDKLFCMKGQSCLVGDGINQASVGGEGGSKLRACWI